MYCESSGHVTDDVTRPENVFVRKVFFYKISFLDNYFKNQITHCFNYLSAKKVKTSLLLQSLMPLFWMRCILSHTLNSYILDSYPVREYCQMMTGCCHLRRTTRQRRREEQWCWEISCLRSQVEASTPEMHQQLQQLVPLNDYVNFFNSHNYVRAMWIADRKQQKSFPSSIIRCGILQRPWIIVNGILLMHVVLL